MKRLIKYLKYSNEVDSKLVRKLAYESSCEYFKDKFCPSIDEQIKYQQTYITMFKHNYAVSKLNHESKI